ncbi:MAG TPA: carboxymuconolactone decarboxylase family protein [Kofleriaceae bacterium]|nr:carboxymuconolactone decarboxylase family protein [Kofleriaceae bacterium]
MATTHEVFDEVKKSFGRVPSWLREVPDSAVQSVWGLMRDFYLAETHIPNKYKELIGIAVSGATRCRYCALFHTEAAKLYGATASEIAEASLMGGVTMQLSTFINAQQTDYEQFRKETADIVAYVKKTAKPIERKPGTVQAHA